MLLASNVRLGMFLLFYGLFCHLEKGRILCSLVKNLMVLYTPIANMATIAPKRGHSVATVAKGRSRLFSNISFPSEAYHLT